VLKRLCKISGKELDSNPGWSYRVDRYERPDGSAADYFFVHTPGSVVIVPEMPDGRLLLLRQFRYLNQRESLEFPGGGVKQGYQNEDAAREELLEEAGLIAGELISIGQFNPMNGATDELCEVFVARDVSRTAARPEVSEEFEEQLLTVESLEQMIRTNEIWDGMTLAVYSLYRGFENAEKIKT
jgi:ADP-ribose pyrophosphatase